MIKPTFFALPLLLICSSSVLAAANAETPAAYSNVIVLTDKPRKPLPRITPLSSCEQDAAAAAYHRPAQTGVINPCAVSSQDAAGSQGVPITVRSAP